MSLGLKPSADGLSVELKLGSTVLAQLSLEGVEAGTLLASALEAQGLTNTKKLMTPSMVKTAVYAAFNAIGDAPIYACRAWINFNGTGTPAIRGSGNVLSLTDNGTGNYTMNLITPMPDTNYSFAGGCSIAPGLVSGSYMSGVSIWDASIKTVSAFQFMTSYAQSSGGAASIGPFITDMNFVSVQLFR